MIKRFIFLFLLAMALFPLCKPEKKDGKIRLRWVKAYPDETWENVKTGLYWSLSYLGGTLDSTYVNEIIVREDSTHFTLDLVKAGFDQQALNAFGVIIDSISCGKEHTAFLIRFSTKLDLPAN